MANKQPWNHTQTCDYCASQELGADYHYKNGRSGCRHFRGGKSASDRGHSWPKLEKGRPSTG